MSALELRESELRLLRQIAQLGGRALVSDLAKSMGVDESAVHTPLMLLKQRGLVTVHERRREFARCSEEGMMCAHHGLPEERLLQALEISKGKGELYEILKRADIKDEETEAALGWARRRGLINILAKNGEKILEKVGDIREVPERKILQEVCEKGLMEISDLQDEVKRVIEVLRSRGLLEVVEKYERVVEITQAGIETSKKAKPALTKLNADLIKSGAWRGYAIQPYDVKANPPRIYPGKKHPYLEFLDELRELLLAMGFEEEVGPFVEFEFWNFDALFQAQNHPAREVHDSFYLESPREGEIDADEEYIECVKKEHEHGWGYKWDLSIARRFVLRSQTTAVSIRTLHKRRRPPIKTFCLSKVFRPDVVDAKHSIEFHQLDGIIGDYCINFKHLLGTLAIIAKKLGFEEIRFTPGYFPFTEPSVEGFVKHPRLGWIECLGAGLFRPEVLRPLNIDYQVIAWGIGVDRLAMIKLGLNDIRDLHTMRLDKLRGNYGGR